VSLADWLKNSWLVAHESSIEEIAALLAIVERDLANATLAGLITRIYEDEILRRHAAQDDIQVGITGRLGISPSPKARMPHFEP